MTTFPRFHVRLTLVVFLAASCGLRVRGEIADPPLEPVSISQIKVRGFWRQQVKRLTEKWIPHCIRQMEEGGQGRELLNLVHAARVLKGEPAGEFTGTPWSDAYIYNTIEAACLALAVIPAEDTDLAEAQAFLRKKLDEWIPIVLAAQMDDGYLHSFHTVKRLPRYSNTSHHEFYVQGYLLEAGVAHYLATGGKDRRLYEAAKKCGDHLCHTFGAPPKKNWIYGHPGMGHALCRLACLVNEVEGDGHGTKYADLAKFLFDHRHADPQRRSSYQQSHLPVVEQHEAVGHAVRATYFYTGIADLALLYRDAGFLAAADKLWASAVHRKMYITGGVGSTHRGEAFGGDFDLPNESAYCESCAGCGLSFWAESMHRLHGDAHYTDIQERVLYNNILGAVELSGKNFFYQNPLSAAQTRYPWHGCPCCVGNIPRALLAIKDLMLSRNAANDALFVRHFVAGECTLDNLAGSRLRLEQQTEYPWQGEAVLLLTPEPPAEFTLCLRIPDRGESALYTPKPDPKETYVVKLNGQPHAAEMAHGYAQIRRKWMPGDRVELSLPMDVLRVYADERVEANRGRVALQRGPLVYNIEDVDHDDQSRSVVLKPEDTLNAVWRPELLGGVMAIEDGAGSLLAVPNYARLNRGGWSQVWIPENPELAEPYQAPTLASRATVTTSFRTHEGRFDLRAIQGRTDPPQSDVRGTPLFHWWPRLGTREWVQYEFPKPAKVSAVDVYWYDDRAWGNCRVPQSWQVLYRDGADWKPVSGASAYGVERDRFNRVTFDPVTTGALRLEVQFQPNHSAGILQWRVDEAEGDTVYLFSFFRGNGETGLHLAFSEDGLEWTVLNNDRPLLKPEIGSKLMRDPSIVRGPDGVFHMVWTTGWWDKGIGIAHSNDLVEWSEQTFLPVMQHEPEAKNCWAPEIYYDAKTATYLICWATTIPGRFPDTEHPKEENNHRMYCVTTKDFQRYSETALFYEPGFNVIDTFIVKDAENDRYAMFLKNETRHPAAQKNIRVAFSDKAAGPYGPPSEPIHGKYWAEGPTALKVRGRWIVYFDRYTEGRYGAAASRDLDRWEDISDQLRFPKGTRHGTAFEVDRVVVERIMAATAQ